MMNQATGNALWAQLHALGGKPVAMQKTVFPQWLGRVKFNLGCVSCVRKLEKFMSVWPPDFGGKEFKVWSTCLHDYVNKELGKPFFAPEITIAPLTQRGIIQ